MSEMEAVLKFEPMAGHIVDSLVPSPIEGYVAFGHFEDIHRIVKSKAFYPTYISGPSGNGKTMMVKEACSVAKREYVRVNITIETDEDDLIGGFRLIDGETVWQDGPVIKAMELGAVLLLDEIDLGSNKLLCLQPVLEGEGIFVKKTGRYVKHKKGFNVIATANTKGQGSIDGKYIGTNVLNEAFLERFSVTFNQEFPPVEVEVKILTNVLSTYLPPNTSEEKFIRTLVSWANVTRHAYNEGVHTELISTRRLVHICEAFVIFQNAEKAIGLCLNRFDDATKSGFMDLYHSLESPSNIPQNTVNLGVLDDNNDPL